MSIPVDTLDFFRAQWATRFTDSCVIKEETGRSFNAGTGVSTPTFSTTYSGPCLIRPLQQEDVDFGQQLTVVGRYVVVLPHTATGPGIGNLADLTSVTDPFLTGKQFTVMDIKGDTYITARKLLCEEAENG